MSQTCFAHCVDTFSRRQLEPHEIDCVDKCATKLIRFNNRSIQIYADIQTKLMLKRQEEMEQKAKLEMEAQAVEPQTVVNVAAEVEATA